MPELDIIIPVYNEGRNIPATLRSLARGVRARVRVLVCYDFEEDDTLPAVQAHRSGYPELAIEQIKNTGRGAHAAVMTGMAASHAPYVLVYPADDDYNAGIIDTMLAAAAEGTDIVCASRFMPGGSMVGCPWLKALFVRTGNWVLRHMARIPTHDASNGLRLFSRRVIEQIPVESTVGFTYSIELLAKAHRLGWRIAEVPAQWFERLAGQSRFKVLQWLPAYLRWCRYIFVTTYGHRHRALSALMLATLLLTAIPALDTALTVGNAWRGIPPTFTDETFYQGHVENIAKGHYNDGNPYFMERAGEAPLVIFGGAWLNALPQLLGLPFMAAAYFNFIIFSLAFTALYFWLLRELWVPHRWAVLGSLILYLQCYAHVWRPANLQPVYPDIILFYIGFVRLIKNPSRGNIWLLGLSTGASFYLYSYFWQVTVITLGLLFFGALISRQWRLVTSTLWASLIGGVVGAPIIFYMLWLSYASPYFLESIARFGLVYTHLPMLEVVYSGGWVGLVLLLLVIWYWQTPSLRDNKEFRIIAVFTILSGGGLWIMQGSNTVTGILLETGEHLRILILPWLAFSTVVLGTCAWRIRTAFKPWVRAFSHAALGVFALASAYYTYYYFQPFIAPDTASRAFFVEVQSYAGVFNWLQTNEPTSVVVWSDPHQYLSTDLPIFTRHYELYTPMGMWELIPSQEVWERYLVSLYFDPPTVSTLKENMATYLGRQDAFHNAKTIERGVKLCRMFLFWIPDSKCGATPTSVELLGEPFFAGLESKFVQDIKPNIAKYLKKYHVSYIIKDIKLQPQMHPEGLGAKLVYTDGRYEIYRLP